MRWVEKQARYYRAYSADEGSVVPLTILLANAIAIWLFVYLINLVGSPSQPQASVPPHPQTPAILQRALDQLPR